MNTINKYYKNTQDAPPHENVKQFIEMSENVGKAIDIGCGAGRDTIFLIKHHWNVLAIDKEDTQKLIEIKLSNNELKNFRFISQNFESIKLEKNNLIVANFSIPFCNKNYFNKFWDTIVNSIEAGRIFCRKFFRFK